MPPSLPLLVLCLWLGLLAPPLAAQVPQRIVSMNLCTDQLLLLLVDRSRIAALSYLAGNPDLSFLAAEASTLPANRGQAEEVLAFNPDLVLTSDFSATLAANLLERLGHRVERLGFATSMEDVYAQIREMGTFTGSNPEAGQMVAALAESIARDTARLRPLLAGKRAVFFSANGFSYGSATLQHDFLVSLGLHNVAADAGLRGPAPLPLEVLLAADPDFVFTDRRSVLDAQLANPLLLHPALTALATRTRFVVLPDRWFQCAGPELANAWRALAAELTGAPATDAQ